LYTDGKTNYYQKLELLFEYWLNQNLGLANLDLPRLESSDLMKVVYGRQGGLAGYAVDIMWEIQEMTAVGGGVYNVRAVEIREIYYSVAVSAIAVGEGVMESQSDWFEPYGAYDNESGYYLAGSLLDLGKVSLTYAERYAGDLNRLTGWKLSGTDVVFAKDAVITIDRPLILEPVLSAKNDNDGKSGGFCGAVTPTDGNFTGGLFALIALLSFAAIIAAKKYRPRID